MFDASWWRKLADDFEAIEPESMPSRRQTWKRFGRGGDSSKRHAPTPGRAAR